jgi:hypothetical protein
MDGKGGRPPCESAAIGRSRRARRPPSTAYPGLASAIWEPAIVRRRRRSFAPAAARRRERPIAADSWSGRSQPIQKCSSALAEAWESTEGFEIDCLPWARLRDLGTSDCPTATALLRTRRRKEVCLQILGPGARNRSKNAHPLWLKLGSRLKGSRLWNPGRLRFRTERRGGSPILRSAARCSRRWCSGRCSTLVSDLRSPPGALRLPADCVDSAIHSRCWSTSW